MFWAKLALFLSGLVGSLAGRVMLALGMSLVSYTALNVLATQIVGYIQTSYSSITGITLQILNLAGAGEGLAIILSAFVTRAGMSAVTMWRHSRFTL